VPAVQAARAAVLLRERDAIDAELAQLLGSASSRGTTLPWCIASVYLFDARQLRSEQTMRGVKRGVASSVIRQQWADAEIYPLETIPSSPRPRSRQSS
jgi:hypothetical protein